MNEIRTLDSGFSMPREVWNLLHASPQFKNIRGKPAQIRNPKMYLQQRQNVDQTISSNEPGQ